MIWHPGGRETDTAKTMQRRLIHPLNKDAWGIAQTPVRHTEADMALVIELWYRSPVDSYGSHKWENNCNHQQLFHWSHVIIIASGRHKSSGLWWHRLAWGAAIDCWGRSSLAEAVSSPQPRPRCSPDPTRNRVGGRNVWRAAPKQMTSWESNSGYAFRRNRNLLINIGLYRNHPVQGRL